MRNDKKEDYSHGQAVYLPAPGHMTRTMCTPLRWVRKRHFIRLCIICAVFVLPPLLCDSSPVAAQAADAFDAVLVSDSGNYVIEYLTEPSPIPVNEMFEMIVRVRERLKKSAAPNVTLQVDAGMSAHNHGMNTMPVVQRLPNRQFRVRGMLFHMRGTWELTFLLKRGIMLDKATQVIHIP